MFTVKQRVQENVSRQRKLGKMYYKRFENGLLEMPLLHFQNWFFGLQFANAVVHPKENSLTTSHFHVIASIRDATSVVWTYFQGDPPLKSFLTTYV
jgi:hypothetical protein